MKYSLLSVWALCVLAGSSFAALPAEAQSPGASSSRAVSSVRFCPRLGCASRMLGGQFQGSDDKMAWTTFAVIRSFPVSSRMNVLPVTGGPAFRYLRYLSPGSSYGNIAELEFDGGANGEKLAGKPFGTPGSFAGRGCDFSRAFDGRLDTFFDAPGPGGNFVGVDLGPVTPPQPPVALPPPAPVGLTAVAQFTANCVITSGMAMPHVLLTWNLTPGAAYYTMYRNGAAVQVGITPNAWNDMDLTSGQTYAYSVSATGPGGEGPRCPAVSITAPSPATGALLPPPANLAVTSAWQGTPANRLSWQPVPGAAGYNVYVSDVQVASGLTATTFTLAPSMFWMGDLYTVTSVNASGVESLPSAPAGYLGAEDPLNITSWANWTPDLLDGLQAVADWNQGAPRIILSWHEGGNRTPVFNVYRDGVKVASHIWRTYYIDTDVLPGASHQYTVSGVNTDLPVNVEGMQSAPLTAAALDSPPSPIGGKVQITKVIPGDDSALVFFTPIPGVADYRIYDVSNPGKVKYAGEITPQKTIYLTTARMPLSIEWNGIDPSHGADLVVEAVDKVGPFQRMEVTSSSGIMTMNSASGLSLNGQGDPSNIPVTLAKSDPVHVDCVPFALTGDQVFFDNFRNPTSLVRQSIPGPLPDTPYYGNPTEYAVYANDKWEMREFGCDLTNTKLFFMDNHFMDVTFDGDGNHSYGGPHNNIASLAMMPKATADISGGKVLHVTFEMDAHLSGRRWASLMIGEAGDELIDPAKFDDFSVKPTLSGKILRWEIQKSGYDMRLFMGDGNMKGVDLMQPAPNEDLMNRVAYDYVSPLTNGTRQDLDKRHRFDLYLSKTHYRIVESTPDGMYSTVRDRDFPPGVSLPFDKCQVYFIHQVYHTANDRQELMSGYPDTKAYETYWFNLRPFSDERHWDNMGQEVLGDFPK